LQSVEAVLADREADKERTFILALLERANPLTYLFIGINVGLFVLMWLTGGMGATSADPVVLVGFGAKVNSLIDQGQYWRLVTSIFLHIGFLHLFFNNYALWIVGQEIERLYGSSRFVVIYLVTGLAGSVASYLYNPKATSAGASGAIYGLFGALAAFAFRYRKEIPDRIRKDIIRRIIPVILINLALSFSITVIDKAAHIGGLIVGIALGVIVPYQRPQEKVNPLVWRGLLAIGMAVVCLSFVSAFRNYDGPRPSLSNLSMSPGTHINDFFTRVAQAQNAFIESSNALGEAISKGQSSVDTGALVGPLDTAISGLKATRGIDQRSEQLRESLLTLLEDQKGLVERFAAEKNKDLRRAAAESAELRRRFVQFNTDYNSWAKSIGASDDN
jgi:rhomboid protease GluP